MMRLSIRALLILAALLAPNQAAVGQQEGRAATQREYREQADQGRWRDSRGQTARQGQERQVSGTILRTKQVEVRGTNRKQLVVLLRTEAGRRLIADLGATQNLRDLDLRTGDQITVRGPVVRLGEHQVLMAGRIQADDQWVTVRRPAQQGGQRAARGYPVERQQRQLSGQVQATRRVQLRGSDRRHLVALIRTSGGQRAVVDLGPVGELRDLELQQGDRVSVRGHVMRVRGRPVLLATRVSANQETAQIDRSGVLRQGQRQGQPQRYGDRGQSQPGRRAGRAEGEQAQADGQARTIQTVAKNMEFHPSQIQARPGQALQVRLVNRGEHPHSIEFELPSGEKKLDSPVQPGQSATLRFQAPQEPGTYTFYCPVANHREKGMTGELVVRRAGE